MLFAHFVLGSLVAHQLVKATFYNENGVSRVKLPPQHNIADVLGFDPLSLSILAKGLGLQCQLHNLLIVVI